MEKENKKNICDNIRIRDLFSLKEEDNIKIDEILNNLLKTNNNTSDFIFAVRKYDWKENYRDAVFFVVGQFIERKMMSERALNLIKKNRDNILKMLEQHAKYALMKKCDQPWNPIASVAMSSWEMAKKDGYEYFRLLRAGNVATNEFSIKI